MTIPFNPQIVNERETETEIRETQRERESPVSTLVCIGASYLGFISVAVINYPVKSNLEEKQCQDTDHYLGEGKAGTRSITHTVKSRE